MKQRATRAAWLAGCLLAVAAPAGAERAAKWLPISEGRKWSYHVHTDHVYHAHGAPMHRFFTKGVAQQQVVAERPGNEPSREGIFELEQRRVEYGIDGQTPTSREQTRVYLEVGDDGAFVYQSPPGAVADDGPGAGPLRLLPAQPRPGARWSAGTLLLGELASELTGEVVGLEDVELGDERHADCLHVRLAGTPTGHATVATGRARITGGLVERSFWLCRGIGVTREIIRREIDLEFDTGETARSSAVTTQRLESASTP